MNGGKLTAFASSARVANLPSVVTNVCAGAVLADRTPAVMPLAAACASGVLLCFGGNVLNDWADRGWDIRHRPERALPRGVFRPGFFLGTSLVAMVLSLAIAGAFSRPTLPVFVALAGFVLLYTWLHKRHPLAVLAMGACRALLPIAGALAVGGLTGPVWGFSVALFGFITGLSLFARGESRPVPAGRSWLLICAAAPLLAWAALPEKLSGATHGIAVGCVLAAVASAAMGSGHVGVRVSRLLLAIPLLDAVVLFHPADGMTALLPVIALILAFALQRVSAAT